MIVGLAVGEELLHRQGDFLRWASSSSVRTSKPPIPGSRSTASSALASEAGACSCRSSGSA